MLYIYIYIYLCYSYSLLAYVVDIRPFFCQAVPHLRVEDRHHLVGVLCMESVVNNMELKNTQLPI